MPNYADKEGTVTWVYKQILPQLIELNADPTMYECEKYYACFVLTYQSLKKMTTHIEKQRLCNQYLTELCKCKSSQEIVDLANNMLVRGNRKD